MATVPAMSRRTRLGVLLAAALLFVGAACSSDSKTSTVANSGAASPAVPAASGSIKVSAAASLTEAFNDLQGTLKTEQPNVAITYNFGGSGALVTQIQQGAEVDVIATADTATMKKLQDDGTVEDPVIFAQNKLEILVQPGNPKRIKTLADLARQDVTFVAEDDSVPAGKYSAQALSKAGVTVSPVSKETDVKAAVAKVTSGEADATIVYQTDVTAAASKGEGVQIPGDQNVIAEYPIAIVKASKNHRGAAAFIDAVVHGSGQGALQKRGFLSAT
jgi:molybdate transport system substrate-binding protein